jgi:DNA ligase 1
LETLKPVLLAIDDIASDNSRLIKEDKIKKYLSLPYFTDVIKYAYDYNKKYNVTFVPFVDHEYDIQIKVLFEYLDYLSGLNGASDNQKNNLAILSSIDDETNELVNRIINKDLKCGCGENSFSKYIKDLPIFEIMTCIKNMRQFLKLAGGKHYYWSKKKDGVRTVNFVFKDYVQSHLSRSGLEYSNFSIFDDELIELAKLIKENTDLQYPILIDGEAISDGGIFNTVMTQIRKIKDCDMSSFKLHIFDLPCNKILSERYNILNTFVHENFKKLTLVEHTLCNYNEQQLVDLAKDTFVNGDVGVDEGVVVKIADSPYVWKEHSKYWCKCKPTDSLDLPVTGYEFGTPGTRLENVVGKLIVNFRGKEVRVGSGYSDLQREEFLDNLPNLIEIEFKEITKDGSLREPVFKRVRDDKRISD